MPNKLVKTPYDPKNIAEHQVNRRWLSVPDWLQAEQELSTD